MTLKQRREQVAKDAKPTAVPNSSAAFLSPKRSQKGSIEDGEKGASTTSVIPYTATAFHSELYGPNGTLIGVEHKAPTPKYRLGGFTPSDGDKLTLKTQIYYTLNQGAHGYTDNGLQKVDVRAVFECGDLKSDPGPVVTLNAPSEVHGDPYWGGTPQPGAALTYDLTYHIKLCQDAVAQQHSKHPYDPIPAPVSFRIILEGRTEGKAWEDGFVTGWLIAAEFDDGYALPGLPVGQTYGTDCDGSNSASAAHCSNFRGVGVNTATGAFSQSVTDATVPGAFPLDLTRSYSSNNTGAASLGVNADSASFGAGWSASWDAGLNLKPSGDVTFQGEDGSQYLFTKATDGTFTSPATVHSTLRTAGDGYELQTNTGDILTFDDVGKLTKHRTLQGQDTVYGRDDTGLLKTVTTSTGQQAAFSYTGILLSEISLSDGRNISYGYNDGKLASVTAPDGREIDYGYDAPGHLNSVTDSRGSAIVANKYDASGRVIEQTGPDSGKVTFIYKNGETDSVMPDGGIWTDVYHENVLLATYDPFGNKTSFGYTLNLDPSVVTDALGNRTVSAVDGNGRLLQEAGPITKRSWYYRSTGVVYSYVNGNHQPFSYGYDSTCRLTTSKDALGNVASYTYSANGQLESVTDPRQKVTRYGYDTKGNQTSVTLPDGSRQTQEFDAVGRVTSVTDPRGNVPDTNPADFTSTYTYDNAGRVLTAKDAKGNTTTNTYDAAGNLETVTDSARKVTRYTYDTSNRLIQTKDPAGNISTTTYDVMGNVSSRTDAIGAKTTYTYDKAGRIAGMTTPRGNVAGADPTKYTWKYGYDKVGNQLTVTDPVGGTTATAYDAESRPISVTDPLGHVQTTKYDGEGNVVETTDALSKTTTNTYDANGQLTSTKDRNSNTVNYTYDADGNQTSETSPLGYKTTYSYDENGRLTGVVEPRGNVTGADPAQYTWRSEYDPAGNLVSQSDPLGNKTTTAYGPLGNLLEHTDPRGRKTAYAYDTLHRLSTVIAPDGGTTTMGYDDLGNLTSRKDPNGHSASYAYDKVGRLLNTTDALGRATSYEYDPDGNRVKATNARAQTVMNTYDARNLLTKATYSDGTPAVTYTYDAAGQPMTIADGTGTRTFTYDAEGRPLSITSPGATNPFKYTYDSNGSVKSRTYPDGWAMTYAYDTDGRMTGQTAAGATTTYSWDEAGNLLASTLPSTPSLTQARTYDRAGRVASNAGYLTALRASAGAQRYERDAAGHVTNEYPTDKDGIKSGNSTRYDYDDTGRLTRTCTDADAVSSCLDGSTGTSYAYDKVGNLTRALAGTATTANTYDVADQLTKTVAGTTATDLTYDADGNLTKDDDGTYAYDAVGRVKSAKIGANTFTFGYDADGNRTTSNKNGALDRTSRWDVVNPLPQIATDTTGSNALLADYMYNPEGVIESTKRPTPPPTAPPTPDRGDTHVFYLLHNRQNSITNVYDSLGQEDYRYTYSAWGEATGTAVVTGGQPSYFGYTGQYKDEYLKGRWNLRDRSYDSGTGRFTTQDPQPAGNDSPNLSPYAYANNDPINQSDPSGRCPLCVSAGVGALIGGVVDGGIYSWQHRNGGFTWGDFAKATGEGAVTGGAAGLLMPGTGNLVARGLGLAGLRELGVSTLANSGVGAVFSWGVNQAHCRPTDPSDLLWGAGGGAASSLLGPAFKWLKGLRGGKSVTEPFPGISVNPKAIATPKTVYRGDVRSPASVFKTGFQVRASDGNLDLHQYGLYNTPSSWVGTSVRRNLAAMFPQQAKGSTWVYEIDSPGTGINMNKALGLGYVFRAEKEIVFPGGIAPSRIVRAQRWSWGMPTGEIVENPGYSPR